MRLALASKRNNTSYVHHLSIRQERRNRVRIQNASCSHQHLHQEMLLCAEQSTALIPGTRAGRVQVALVPPCCSHNLRKGPWVPKQQTMHTKTQRNPRQENVWGSWMAFARPPNPQNLQKCCDSCKLFRAGSDSCHLLGQHPE